MANRDIVTIGASAGGIEALMKLVVDLPAELPASVFIVQHMSPTTPSVLVDILGARTTLPVERAADRKEIQRGCIYVAPPDRHLLIDRSYMYTTQGPRENHTRPAVDPLFRSAAVVHGPHVVGVVLSGTLDDGTSGLDAIKRCGGVAIVQDPADALYPDMPQSALDVVDVDHSVKLSGMGGLLVRLTREAPGAPASPPLPLLTEVEISRTGTNNEALVNEIGELVPLNCAECGGPLWQIKDSKIARYRCREGHAYTAKTLMAELSESVEQSLWVAVQTMDERVRVLNRLADDEERKGRHQGATMFKERSREAEEHANRVRGLLLTANRW